MHQTDRKQSSLSTEPWSNKSSCSRLLPQSDKVQNMQCVFSVSCQSHAVCWSAFFSRKMQIPIKKLKKSLKKKKKILMWQETPQRHNEVLVYETFIPRPWWETQRKLSRAPCLIGLQYSENSDSFLASCKPIELPVRPNKNQEIRPRLRDTELKG